MRNEVLNSPTNPQSRGSLRHNRITLAGNRQNAIDETAYSPAANNLESVTQSLPPSFHYQHQNSKESTRSNISTSVYRLPANVSQPLGKVATTSLSHNATEDEQLFMEYPRPPSMASDRVQIHKEAATELNTILEPSVCRAKDADTSIEMQPSLTNNQTAAAAINMLGQSSSGSDRILEVAEAIQESSESRAEGLGASIKMQTSDPQTAAISNNLLGQSLSGNDRVKIEAIQELSKSKTEGLGASFELQPSFPHTAAVNPLDHTSPSIALSQIASPNPTISPTLSPQHSPASRPPSADEMVHFRSTSPRRTVKDWIVYTLADVKINEGEDEQIRYRRYCWHLFTISVFYALPAFQLILTYQELLNITGNQDICYYNYLCSHKLGAVRSV